MKYFIALVLVLLTATSLFAQSTTQNFISKYNGTVEDTVVNTTAKTIASPKIESFYDLVGVEVRITKVSGTVAGTLRLFGSYDGTNWVRVNASDSLIVPNTATAYKSFTVTSYPYRYLGVTYTPTGTMSAKMRASALYKRKP